MQGWDIVFAGLIIGLVVLTVVISARRKKMKAGCHGCAYAGDCAQKDRKCDRRRDV